MERIRVGRAGGGRPRTRPEHLGGDKAYSSRRNRRYLRRRQIKHTIPEPKSRRANRKRRGSDDPAEQLAWRRLTARHGDRLGEIMDEYGWPMAELVGEEAARAAWLIAQHADRQLDVQRRALRLMEQAVSAGSASPRELAFLRDRTLVNEGRKQVYGTQIAGVKEGSPVPWPCEEPDRMDELRAEVGIEPFDVYAAKFAMP